MVGGVVERDVIFAGLTLTIEGLRSRRGATHFVVGEAGLGKSVVLAHVASQVSDATVVSAAADRMESTIPFGLAEQVMAALGVPFASADRADAGDLYARTLQALAERAPMVIVLDDLHWADTDSLHLFAYVARRVSALPIAVVASMRPWPAEAHDLALQLWADGHASIDRLEPLSHDGMVAIMESRLGPLTPDELERTWSATSGNPLLVEQVIAARMRGDRVPPAATDKNEAAKHLLLSRFAGLDEPAMQCARAACVLGTTFRPDVAAEMAGLWGVVIDDALESLVRSGLFETVGTDMRFVHQLFAQLLYDDIDPALRRRMHARAFTILVERGREERAAEHAIRADLVGDNDAIELLRRLGSQAVDVGATRTARRLLGAAVAFSGDRVTADLELAYAEALALLGERDRASDVCDHVLSRRDVSDRERARALRTQGRALVLTGSFEQGAMRFGESFDVASDHDLERMVDTLLDRALAVWLSHGPAAALPYLDRARAIAKAAGAEVRERADAVWGSVALQAGDPSGIQATLGPGRYLAGMQRLDASQLTWPFAPVYMFATAAAHDERYDDAAHALDLAESVLVAAGDSDAVMLPILNRCDVLLRRGQLDRALEEALRVEAVLQRRLIVFPLAELLKAEALLHLGRTAECEHACAELQSMAGLQWMAAMRLNTVKGVAALSIGDARTASDLFLAVESAGCEAGVKDPSLVRWAIDGIEAHTMSGRLSDAQRVIAWVEDGARTLPSRWPAFASLTGRALMARATGHDADALDLFRDAHDVIAGTVQPLQHAFGALRYGRHLRRLGRLREARAPLADAARIAASLGAWPTERAAAAELRLAGGRRRSQSTTATELTAAERRVALAAKDGATNAEIAGRLHLSVNTVESHLKRVFAKLQIASRRELGSLSLEVPTDLVR